MDLDRVSRHGSNANGATYRHGPRTVLSLRPFLAVGTFFHGSQPQPARRPPGVWKTRKLSPSPTLVTWPKTLRRRRNEGEILGASGILRRYERWNRIVRRIPLVRMRVGTRVLSSVKAFQSRMELFELVCLSSLVDSELHGSLRITTHATMMAGVGRAKVGGVVVGVGDRHGKSWRNKPLIAYTSILPRTTSIPNLAIVLIEYSLTS